MATIGADAPSASLQARFDRQVDSWRNELINFTRRNKLLNFKHSRSSSLELSRPTSIEIARRLDTASWEFFSPPDDDVETTISADPRRELVTNAKSADELSRVLRNLERSSSQAYVDAGVWILYVGFGILKWVDPDDGASYESPLLLRPVTLTRESFRAPFRLTDGDDDPTLNQALALKLEKDLDIVLPGPTEIDLDPASVCNAVRRAVAGRRGWSVEDRAVLTTFTFHKEAMYRDLLDNAELVKASALVQVLALGQHAPAARSLEFDPAHEDTLELVAPPEAMVSVCDADSTQRACIVAARDHRSFVMDGPPGSGKSQTITNMIAELIHAGRSVLFVSEKAAALEVVHNRLTEAKLDEFVLELHSHKATRKEVAAALGRALGTRPHLPAHFAESDKARLISLREELNDYAIAVNVRREPLGRSVHDVLGRVVGLQHHQRAPIASQFGSELTVGQLNASVDAAQRLGRAWGPVDRGDAFVWRDLASSVLSGADQQSIQSELTSAADAMVNLMLFIQEIDDVVGLGWTASSDDCHRLRELLAHIESCDVRYEVPPAWLTDDDLTRVTARRAEVQSTAAHYQELVATAMHVGGDSWAEAPVVRTDDLSRNIEQIVATEPTLPFVCSAGRPWLATAMQSLQQAVFRLERIECGSRELEARLGLDHAPLAPSRVEDLVEIGAMVESPDRPERGWLDPLAQMALTEAESVLSSLVLEYRAHRDRLHETFDDDVITLDLDAINERLTQTSGLKKLSSAYRADKKLLASHVIGMKVTPQARDRLLDAVAWRHGSIKLDAAESTHRASLGRYYSGRLDTDLERLTNALALARRALALAGGSAPAALVDELSADGLPPADVIALSHALRDDALLWRTHDVEALRRLGVDVGDRCIPELRAWAEQTLNRLRLIDEVLADIESTTGQALNVADAKLILDIVTVIQAIDLSTADLYDQDRELLGPRYIGLSSDFDAIAADLEWASTVRALVGEPIDRLLADALLQLSPSADRARQSLDEVDRAWTRIADRFEDTRAKELSADFAISLEDGSALLDELRRSTHDIDEWSRYTAARDELLAADLRPVIDFAEYRKLPAAAVAEVVERSILEGWLDAVLSADPRLKTLAPTERDEMVQRFQELDRQQVSNASARVVAACAARRPSTTAGAAGRIRREAEKKTRHMPIRDLLREAGDVALALKPCFMMSPLTVSQFLPPTMTFDVVIFDEASQVKPADAINCIYRGRQVIVAGDPKQLPPTTFFDQLSGSATDEYDPEVPEDFESVLDGFRSSGLPTLPLSWHYRSRHEALITYSNYRFYEGRLRTFPSAVQAGDGVGVTFVNAHGTYRRGGARDNPIEAAKVVERVLFHRQAHPDLTIGVVAFSAAQASAIEAEIENQAQRHPELNKLRLDDRLDGFFVKNLENVQGDERDIILFSIGYGPDENGRFTEQLGPLGMQGGERRLNVAITRARSRVEVISSVTAAEFPGTSPAPGIRHLQNYLAFAEHGMSALALDIDTSSGDVESPFEEEVLRVVREMGYDATPQVGVAGFRIDLGVRHPGRPGEFVLGIECDGAAYHSSKVARDRDRLRQEILERLGWRIHRIWGPSWYRSRDAQSEQLRNAIEDAIAGRRSSRTASPEPRSGAPEIEIRDAVLDQRPAWARTYVVAVPKTPITMNEADFTSAHARRAIVLAIGEIVDAEGPIHHEVVRRRVQEWFGIARMSAARRDSFDKALASYRRSSACSNDGAYLSTASSTKQVVRVPDEQDATRRTVAQIASSERQLAIQLLVTDARRISRDELMTGFARLFGWQRAGADIRSSFERDLGLLLKAGALIEKNGIVEVKGQTSKRPSAGQRVRSAGPPRRATG